jgi:thiol-disulfide isomerase/thioredoxin
MAYLTVGVLLVGLLGVLNLLLMFGVVRRLREQSAGSAVNLPDAPSILAPGSTVGSFSVPDAAGVRLTRDSLAEGLMVTFMSPGCPACEDLLPLVVERAREHGPDRVVAAVVRDTDDERALREFVDRLSEVARVAVTEFGDGLTEAFELTGLPAYVEMGADGRVVSSGRTLPRNTAPAGAGA